MRSISNFLTEELIVGRMRRALKGVHNLDVAIFRIDAYRKAGVPTEQIRDFDSRAWDLEVRRRRVMDRQPVKTACEALALIILVTAILLLTPSAHAAEVQPMSPGADAVFWIGVGMIVLSIILLCMKFFRPRSRVRIEDCEEVFGDTAGYERDGKWR